MNSTENPISRRSMLAATAAGGMLTATTLAVAQTGEPAQQSGPKEYGADTAEPGHHLAAGHRSRHVAELALFI
jgi:hypothetical protein